MTWTPAPTVTIGDTAFTTAALETVRIQRGRDQVYAEPRAGYAILELIDLDGTGINLNVLDTLTVTVNDAAGQPVTLFTGSVSDWSARLYDSGFESGTARSITTVIAVGPLAKLNRRNVFPEGLAAEKDGDRILNLVRQGTTRTWEEFPALQWNEVGPSVTWNTVDPGFDDTRIDTPGVFDIVALPAEDGGYNPLTQSYLTAISGRGVLFDDAEGFIAYRDADSRELAANAGYLNIPAEVINAGGLTTSSKYADITNRLSVDYPGGAVRISDAQSIIQFGVLANQFELNLADEANAIAWAVDYIEDHAGPVINLSEVAIRLDNVTSDTLRDNLLGIDVGSPVNLETLPSTLGLSQLPAFVEGIGWLVNRQTVELRMNVSDAALSIGSIRWGLVPDTLRWTDVDATLQWQDARRL
jgi:hypothetical protein